MVPGSEKEVYWKCSEGHVWKASICSRTNPRESRCPVCFPRNTAVSDPIDPSLVRIWHPTKNLPLMPSDAANRSNEKFWWKCEKGHEWQSDLKHLCRLEPSKRCPYCNDRAVCADNSLLAKYPELAQEWDDELNFPLKPDQVLYCSSKKYWWRRGDFVWQASVKQRQRKGSGIPRSQYLDCYKHLRLSVTHPDLAAQWDTLKNMPLTPDQVTGRSTKKFGGTVRMDIHGRVLSAREFVGTDAPIAQVIGQARSIVCRLAVRPSLLNGILRKMASLHHGT